MEEIKETLEEKMLALRSKTDYRLSRNSYVMMMFDGRGFSSSRNGIKTRFKRPFDERFVELMNKTAETLCQEIQGAKFAYVQSDEISLFLTDIDCEGTGSFFDYRLSKMLSIGASIATSAFNRALMRMRFDKSGLLDLGTFDEEPLYQFDAKAWELPDPKSVYLWCRFRSRDCLRNSKQQAAQTYIKHKELEKKHVDEQIRMLLEQKGIDWNDYDNGVKFGRLVRHEAYMKTRELNGEIIPFERHRWKAYPLEYPLDSEEGTEAFWKLVNENNLIPEKKEEI